MVSAALGVAYIKFSGYDARNLAPAHPQMPTFKRCTHMQYKPLLPQIHFERPNKLPWASVRFEIETNSCEGRWAFCIPAEVTVQEVWMES